LVNGVRNTILNIHIVLVNTNFSYYKKLVLVSNSRMTGENKMSPKDNKGTCEAAIAEVVLY